MQDRGPAKDSPEDAKVSAELPTMAAEVSAAPTTATTPAPTLPARLGTEASSTRKKGVDDWTGREVAGRYTVLERLGEGGMGVVYVAEHLHLKKKVAFKVIHPHLAAHEELLLRFKREALATGQLDHPHIAAAIDFGELEDGGAFMVMPWVRGHSLQDALETDQTPDFRRAANLCAQIADALSAAHDMGIIHRDLKPDNVLVEVRSDGSESAKVLDFGVASLAGQPESLRSVEARPLTQAGTILGTPGYMSPEQASAGEVDHRTDLYALGVILWELCKGERLFSGSDITAIFAKQFNSVPPPLDLGRSSMARELSELVTRLLAWDKAQRPSTAAEVRDALRRIADRPDTRISSLHIGMEVIPQAYRRYVPHAIGGLALFVSVLIVAFDKSPEPITPEPEAAAASATATKKGDSKGAAAEKKAAEIRQREEKKAADEKKPEVVVAPPARVETAPAEPSQLAGLTGDQATVLDGKTREGRRKAAKRLLASNAKMPNYVKLVAQLEAASSCAEKKGILENMRTLSDTRVLPTLQRLNEQPTRGCGLLRLSDCISCIRRDVEQTLTALER